MPRTARATAARKPPATRRVDAQAEIPLRADGGLRLVVVADTHSHPHPEMGRRLAEERPDAVLHAGDIGDLAVIDALRKHAPVHVVRGNIDTHAADLPDALVLDVVHQPLSGGDAGGEGHVANGERALRILLLHIAVLGPRLLPPAASLAREKGAQVLVCGHSHVPFIGRDRGVTVFNPGSIGPRRFQLPIVYGVMEIAEGRLRMHHVDVATGARWEP